MKKHKIFNEPLLLTQVEIAMLLGLTRTQWTMYTTGQRGLPARTRPVLEKLVKNTNESFMAKRPKLLKIAAQEIEVQKELKTLLQENTLKQLQIQRRLKRMEAQFEAALNTLQFVQQYQNNGVNQLLIQVLELKAHKVLDKNKLALQEVHKIKLEVLEHEKKLLEKRLQKLL